MLQNTLLCTYSLARHVHDRMPHSLRHIQASATMAIMAAKPGATILTLPAEVVVLEDPAEPTVLDGRPVVAGELEEVDALPEPSETVCVPPTTNPLEPRLKTVPLIVTAEPPADKVADSTIMALCPPARVVGVTIWPLILVAEAAPADGRAFVVPPTTKPPEARLKIVPLTVRAAPPADRVVPSTIAAVCPPARVVGITFWPSIRVVTAPPTVGRICVVPPTTKPPEARLIAVPLTVIAEPPAESVGPATTTAL